MRLSQLRRRRHATDTGAGGGRRARRARSLACRCRAASSRSLVSSRSSLRPTCMSAVPRRPGRRWRAPARPRRSVSRRGAGLGRSGCRRGRASTPSTSAMKPASTKVSTASAYRRRPASRSPTDQCARPDQRRRRRRGGGDPTVSASASARWRGRSCRRCRRRATPVPARNTATCAGSRANSSWSNTIGVAVGCATPPGRATARRSRGAARRRWGRRSPCVRRPARGSAPAWRRTPRPGASRASAAASPPGGLWRIIGAASSMSSAARSKCSPADRMPDRLGACRRARSYHVLARRCSSPTASGCSSSEPGTQHVGEQVVVPVPAGADRRAATTKRFARSSISSIARPPCRR